MPLTRHPMTPGLTLLALLLVPGVLHAQQDPASTLKDSSDSDDSPTKCVADFDRLFCGDLACVDGTCSFCEASPDCHEADYLCDPETSTCRHKGLLPLSARDMATILLTGVGGAFAAGSGVGGGGLFVPAFLIVGNFAEGLAIPLSKAMIFGGAVANLLLNLRRAHPLDTSGRRPLIDCDVALVMEPLTLCGTMVGVILNVLLPDFVTLALLVAVLTVTALRTYRKGLKFWREEEAAAHSSAFSDNEVEEDESQGLLGQSNRAATTAPEPWAWKVVLLAVVWVFIVVVSLARGGHGAHACSVGGWALLAMCFAVTAGQTIVVGRWLVRRHGRRIEGGQHVFLTGDIMWTRRNTLLYPALCMGAGVMAGMLGIGGGMIKGPLLLELGMIPEVTAATSAFMILFTSSATTAQFFILGRLPLAYAVWFMCAGFLSSVVGQLVINGLVRRFRKASLIVFCIAGLVGASAILLGLSGARDIWNDVRFGRYEPWGKVCGAE